MNEKPIEKAVRLIGGPSETARRLGVKPPTVSQWLSDDPERSRPVPESHCPDLESGSGGVVTCEQLRPDSNWLRIKDSNWPHPDGRPLIDHANKPVEKKAA